MKRRHPYRYKVSWCVVWVVVVCLAYAQHQTWIAILGVSNMVLWLSEIAVIFRLRYWQRRLDRAKAALAAMDGEAVQ
jgi:hypothetical protein